jgi:amidohydrolase
MNCIETVRLLAKKYFTQVVEIRRHLHRYPELSFNEHGTMDYIAQLLNKNNISFTQGHAGTGIIAVLKGNAGDKTLALRADIDALPIEEKNDVPYASVNKGAMHACGHDAHTASLIGTLLILNELKANFSGEIKFIFQPGEEKLPGGASLLLKENALGNPLPQAILGQHVFPQLEVGKVGFKKGLYMASTDEIYITVIGKGGHAAMPHLCIDPITTAAHIITALQQITSRYSSPIIPTVLSFGKIIGNGATNVIPDQVTIEGTFRTFNEEWRYKAHQLIKQIAEHTALSFGASCQVKIEKGYPFLLNNESLTEFCKQAAIDFLGQENVVDLELRMTAEDFAYYSQVMPACFYRLGTGNQSKGITANVHTPTFDIDEEALLVGSGLMAYIALKYLS